MNLNPSPAGVIVKSATRAGAGSAFCPCKILELKRINANAFKIFIERNERPFNFMSYDEEEEEVRRKHYERKNLEKEVVKMTKKAQEENLERILKKQKEAATKKNVTEKNEREREELEADSQPIRHYLLHNLV